MYNSAVSVYFPYHSPVKRRPKPKLPPAPIEGLVDAPPVVLHCDGACHPNPGPMGIGYILQFKETGKTIARVGAPIGEGTNNVAEYQALLAGMRHALKLGLYRLEVRMDSNLVVQQVSGKWAVKKKFLARFQREAVNLARLFQSFKITHIRREENTQADYLSRELVYEEVSYPPPIPRMKQMFQPTLRSWQAASVRYWNKTFHPGVNTLRRIFGASAAQMEQIINGVTYRDASFMDHPVHVAALEANPLESHAIATIATESDDGASGNTEVASES